MLASCIPEEKAMQRALKVFLMKPTLNPDLVPAPSRSGQKEVRIGSEGLTEAGT